MAHLAAVLSDVDVRLLDDAPPAAAEVLMRGPPVVFTTDERNVRAGVALELCPWGQDEWIEYVLRVHPGRCAAVMARVLAAAGAEALEGLAELWAAALDEFARDDGVADLDAALRLAVARRLGSPARYEDAVRRCLRVATTGAWPRIDPAVVTEDVGAGRLLRHAVVCALFAGEGLAAEVMGGTFGGVIGALPGEVLISAAERLRARQEAFAGEAGGRLRAALADAAGQAQVASLLAALEPGWCPAPQTLTALAGAKLATVTWAKVALKDCDCTGADFRGADLSGATFVGVLAEGASFRGAHLTDAAWSDVTADRANFAGADMRGMRLTRLRARGANFRGATFVPTTVWRMVLDGAVLDGVLADGAWMPGTRLFKTSCVGARFRGAKLAGAHFGYADVRDADFAGADLAGSKWCGVRLREGAFEGATFSGAELIRCDLEGMVLPYADFQAARLDGSYFTGSRMRGADFRDASFANTGLAEVDWEGADLRDADLSGASFHLGSSRSGLVGSTIASEGSRTGFYTDEFEDRTFKPPEEIRKANLAGCDLRGARVADADFYLVDLRGARMTEDQAVHFRRCGAIMDPRGPRGEPDSEG
jgi:uncharacterized protein YjbI with pentapeptide repeats